MLAAANPTRRKRVQASQLDLVALDLRLPGLLAGKDLAWSRAAPCLNGTLVRAFRFRMSVSDDLVRKEKRLYYSQRRPRRGPGPNQSANSKPGLMEAGSPGPSRISPLSRRPNGYVRLGAPGSAR